MPRPWTSPVHVILLLLVSLLLLGWAASSAATASPIFAPLTLVEHLFTPLQVRTGWEARTLHARRNDSSYFAWLLSVRDVDRVIESGLALGRKGRLENTKDIKLIRRARGSDGEWWSAMAQRSDVVELAEAHAAFGAGFTIVINKMNYRLEEVARAAAALSAELGGARVNANLYLSPADGEQQG